MKIEYQEPTVMDRIEAAIADARDCGRDIKCIRLSAPELAEFCELGGLAFNKESTYTYKDFRVAYDWESHK